MRCCDFKTGTKWPEKNEDSIVQNQFFSTNYRKYAVTRNYKDPVFYGVREKQVSAFSGSREEGAGRSKQEGGSREEQAGRRKQGGASREEEAGRSKQGGGRDVP